jgi:hypothetical protein
MTAIGRVLVLDGDLSSAAAVAVALADRGCTARIALPVTLEHLVDVLSWEPDIALIDVDNLGATSSNELAELLDERNVPFVIVTAQADQVDKGSGRPQIVVDKGPQAMDVLPMLADMLGLNTDDLGEQDGPSLAPNTPEQSAAHDPPSSQPRQSTL